MTMPININDVVEAHPVDVPWAWFVVISMVFAAGFVSLYVAYIERRDTSVVAYTLMVVLSAFSGITLALSVGREALDSRAADLSSQIQEHYKLEVSPDAARTLLSTSPVELVHENTLYTISVVEDGSVVVTDPHGNLVHPK